MYKILMGLILMYALSGCTKEPLLEDLEHNKWEENIPSTIIIDSSSALPVDPTFGNILVYISFNESSLEQEWSNVSKIHAVYKKITFPVGPEITKEVNFSNGQAVFNPPNTNNSTTYSFRFYIEFDNGRNTLWTSTYNVIAPPF